MTKKRTWTLCKMLRTLFVLCCCVSTHSLAGAVSLRSVVLMKKAVHGLEQMEDRLHGALLTCSRSETLGRFVLQLQNPDSEDTSAQIPADETEYKRFASAISESAANKIVVAAATARVRARGALEMTKTALENGLEVVRMNEIGLATETQVVKIAEIMEEKKKEAEEDLSIISLALASISDLLKVLKKNTPIIMQGFVYEGRDIRGYQAPGTGYVALYPSYFEKNPGLVLRPETDIVLREGRDALSSAEGLFSKYL